MAALIASVKDPLSPIREAAATSLGEIGPGAKDAVPVLRDALKDDDTHVRAAASTALQRIERRTAK